MTTHFKPSRRRGPVLMMQRTACITEKLVLCRCGAGGPYAPGPQQVLVARPCPATSFPAMRETPVAVI